MMGSESKLPRTFARVTLGSAASRRAALRSVALFALLLAGAPSRSEDSPQKKAGIAGHPEARPAPGKPGEAKVTGTKAAETKPGDTERWRKLSPERREQLRKLYERLQKLSPEARLQLLDRMRSLEPHERREAIRGARAAEETAAASHDAQEARRDLVRRQMEKLSADEKERLRQMPPADRRRWLSEKFKSRRNQVLAKLPPEERAKVQALPSREQAEAIRSYLGAQLFKDTFRIPAEIEILRGLPPRRLVEALRGKPREGILPTRPASLSEETWKRWADLQPYQRGRLIQHILGQKLGGVPRVRHPDPK